MARVHVLGSGSAGNCYLLETKTGILVIEAGVKFKELKKYLNFDLSRVNACIISHEHGDHSKYFSDFLKNCIPVFCGKETRGKLEPVLINRNIHGFESGQEFYADQFKIKPLSVAHDVPCYAFMIYHIEFGVLVFATDTYLFPYKIKANYWLIEANYSEDILLKNINDGKLNPVVAERSFRSHMSIDTALLTLKQQDLNECKKIILLHLSNGNSSEKQFVDQIENEIGIPCTVASCGLIEDL